MLEKYFRQRYAEMERVTLVSRWWDRKGENEIDLIALEQLDHRATVAEVKRNAKKFSVKELEYKYQFVKQYLRGYSVQLIGLSLDDM